MTKIKLNTNNGLSELLSKGFVVQEPYFSPVENIFPVLVSLANDIHLFLELKTLYKMSLYEFK